MPRKILHPNPTLPYHISSRCINREWFTNIDYTWELFEDYLFLLQIRYEVEIFAFVLMDNHFHLIARFARNNMSESMGYFLRETSKQMIKKSGRINRTWGGRFFRSSISSLHYYYHCYKYVYRNPISAGATNRVELYKYSTIGRLLGLTGKLIPVIHDDTLFANVEETIKWLNTRPDDKNLRSVRLALRKQEFALPIDRVSRKPHKLENDML